MIDSYDVEPLRVTSFCVWERRAMTLVGRRGLQPPSQVVACVESVTCFWLGLLAGAVCSKVQRPVPGPLGNLSKLAPFGLPKLLRVASLCVGEKEGKDSHG